MFGHSCSYDDQRLRPTRGIFEKTFRGSSLIVLTLLSLLSSLLLVCCRCCCVALNVKQQKPLTRRCSSLIFLTLSSSSSSCLSSNVKLYCSASSSTLSMSTDLPTRGIEKTCNEPCEHATVVIKLYIIRIAHTDHYDNRRVTIPAPRFTA